MAHGLAHKHLVYQKKSVEDKTCDIFKFQILEKSTRGRNIKFFLMSLARYIK